MTLSEIESLPVRDLCDDTAWLFIWTVNSFVEQSYGVARAWGFRPVTLLTWCKPPVGIGPGGMFSTTTEFVLYCRRGSSPGGREKSVNTSWFQWPRGRQSVKPEAFQDLIEQHFSGPYLELFARRQRLGWDTWGNQALEHITLTRGDRKNRTEE
jgi:N6-adenosine-specific RNA methylase IME4